MTLTLELDKEQQDALTAYTAEWNGPNGTATIEDRIIADAIMPFVKGKVDAAYALSVSRIGDAAKNLSYDARLALIAQVETSIQN